MKLESSYLAREPSSKSHKPRHVHVRVHWKGVIATLTTPFNDDLNVDHRLLADHCRWLAEHGVAGIMPAGAMGEVAVLSHAEKRQIFETCVGAVGERLPVIPKIATVSTVEAIALAKHARAVGCHGLMVAPPEVPMADWREIRAHLAAVFSATDLPCMLSNQRAPYRVEFTPEKIEDLAAEFPQLKAVNETGGDAARISAIRERLGHRLQVFTCVGDAVVDGIGAGASGWISCLVNAFPAESVALYRHVTEGRVREASELYEWFLPLLRMDSVPKYVQLVKLAQEQVGRGSSRVRPPRLSLAGEEFRGALATIGKALATRPRAPAQQ